jgi:hypothetical protein
MLASVRQPLMNDVSKVTPDIAASPPGRVLEAAERARTASNHYLARVLKHVIAECDGLVLFGRTHALANPPAPDTYVRYLTQRS